MSQALAQQISEARAKYEALVAEQDRIDNNIWGLKVLNGAVDRTRYFVIKQKRKGFSVDSLVSKDSVFTSSPVLTSEYAAEEAATAFQVMLELRTQAGQTGDDDGYFIYVTKDGRVSVHQNDAQSSKVFSGSFGTKEKAKAAIAAVGADRIAGAFNYLVFGA